MLILLGERRALEVETPKMQEAIEGQTFGYGMQIVGVVVYAQNEGIGLFASDLA
jgi:hypothetical protein